MQFKNRKEEIMAQSQSQQRRIRTQDAVVGIAMIAFGSLLLLQQLDVFYLESIGIRSLWQAWPVIFIFIGIAKLADAPTLYHIGNGVWWIFLGAWLYVSINHVFGLRFSETWPAIIIAWGISMMWESFTKDARKKEKEYNYVNQ